MFESGRRPFFYMLARLENIQKKKAGPNGGTDCIHSWDQNKSTKDTPKVSCIIIQYKLRDNIFYEIMM